MDKETAPAAASPARSEGYAKGRVTKQAIVERAAEAFAEKGFYGASLRSIAREAGIDHSTLLHHFGNKTALLVAVIAWHDAQGLPPEYQDATSTAERTAHAVSEVFATLPLSEIADRIVSNARRNASVPGLVQLQRLLTTEAASPTHPARAMFRERHDALRSILAAAIARGREESGDTSDALTPEQRAVMVISTWEGLETYDALHPGEVDVPEMLRRVLDDAFALTR